MDITSILRSRARKAARKKEWAVAATYYRKLCNRRHPRVEDEIQLGHTLKEMGNLDEALAVYLHAAEKNPQNIDAQRQAGLFLKRLKRNDEATNYFARGLILNNNDEIIRSELENLKISDENLLDKYYLRGALISNESRQPPHLLKQILTASSLAYARKCARKKNWAEAERAYRKILRLDSNRINILVQLGHVLREQKKGLEALNYYRYALLFTPRDPDIYIHIGHALKLLGRESSASKAYLTALRLKPGFSAAIQELGDAPTQELGEEIRNNDQVTNTTRIERSQLVEEPWLDLRQKSIFKFLSGSLAYKE
ncbi:tetratricopeptide repeat protein [Zymomonas mobilis]|uniref:tetratricopeptide repeat protein n=1 Tax=Zymomonas mobilis TaxID=542 RepID=UPI0021C4A775|nr:hypothetical protein [Zymomonas mobilis]MCP9307822.1 hypothetical protein [Zymomonas mobilis]